MEIIQTVGLDSICTNREDTTFYGPQGAQNRIMSGGRTWPSRSATFDLLIRSHGIIHETLRNEKQTLFFSRVTVCTARYTNIIIVQSGAVGRGGRDLNRLDNQLYTYTH